MRTTDCTHKRQVHVADTEVWICEDCMALMDADDPTTETDQDVIVNVEYYGGHSEITYRWRDGIAHSIGPAGRTAERITAIRERQEGQDR